MTERERLTTDRRKIFARESLTLMSMNKDELRQHYNEVFDRLQEYEVEEENSKTIELPCNIGDTVYVDYYYEVVTAYVEEFIVTSKGVVAKVYIDPDTYREYDIEDIHLTKEEAEKALKEWCNCD